jgi:hypothetical protein
MNNPKVDQALNTILEIMKEQNAHPMTCESMDTIFRAYMHWASKAQRDREDTAIIRKAMLAFVASMAIDMSTRMTSKHKLEDRDVWLGEFVLDLRDEIMVELAIIDEVQTGNA